jgi:hypothetical protein
VVVIVVSTVTGALTVLSVLPEDFLNQLSISSCKKVNDLAHGCDDLLLVSFQ